MAASTEFHAPVTGHYNIPAPHASHGGSNNFYFNAPSNSTDIHSPRRRMPSYPLSSVAPIKTFVQRPALLDSIREQMLRDLDANRKGEVKKVGVWGMGGAGKSQLTLSYLQCYQTEYDATFWFQADQTASIDRDFLAIYRLLPETAIPLPTPTPEEVKQAVLSWFARESGKWLLIFDGADHLYQTDKDYVALSEYFPGSSNIHIIITSRAYIAKQLSTFEGVSVGELEESQSVDLFLNCAEIQPSRDNVLAEAKEIVNEMGHLALAISMAGKYVLQTPRLSSNLSAYLGDFRRRRRDLLSEKPDKLIAGYDRSVMTVWETSYSAVREQLPEACRLLTLLSFIHYKDIFLELFGLAIESDSIDGSDPIGVASWTSIFGPEVHLGFHRLEECFTLLEKYSLCQRQVGQTSYSIHRLIHAWGYDRLQVDGNEMKQFWLAASLCLEGYLGTIDNAGNTPASKLRLVPHILGNIQSYRRISKTLQWDRSGSPMPLESFGYFLFRIGRCNDAMLAQREVLKDRIRTLGNEHPDTIKAMSNLANTLADQGQLHEATSMQREVLQKSQQSLGTEHPDTISVMSNLACTLLDQGQLDEAAGMQRVVLEKRQRIFGDDHPDTISAMHNLASTLLNQGQLDEAAGMIRGVLEKRQQTLGDMHPDTIKAMSILANTLTDQGQLDEATGMQREVLKKSQQSLGDEHPNTISAMNNLAGTLRCQGQLDEAAGIMREVLEKRQRILGDMHPDTISAMGNLASTLGYQGQLDEAAGMKREVLKKSQQSLGDEHPNTISAMNNLAGTLRCQGHLDEATGMMREVLEKRQRILGDEHPDTITAMKNLSILLS
ncbi:hypothetical protein EDB81DRAFT_733687, partial [Dactylonectria macrodidyma]